jgi:hypothetical protein
MSDETAPASIDVTIAFVPERRPIEQWAELKGLDPHSWVFASLRTQFRSVINAESTEAEFDQAHHAALNTPHTA